MLQGLMPLYRRQLSECCGARISLSQRKKKGIGKEISCSIAQYRSHRAVTCALADVINHCFANLYSTHHFTLRRHTYLLRS